MGPSAADVGAAVANRVEQRALKRGKVMDDMAIFIAADSNVPLVRLGLLVGGIEFVEKVGWSGSG